MEKLEYMEGLALKNAKQRVQLDMFKMIKDFREEGFEDEDIYDYMRDIVLNIMHGNTYKAIEEMLKEENK